MTDQPSDDPRLRSAEAHMRRMLGLHGDTPRPSSSEHPVGNSGSHPQRRRFVRDGEVPVTVIHRDQNGDTEPGANQLEAARQAIRSQASARERAERLLEQAQAAIRELQTRNAHERLAKDEAIERAAAAKLAGDQALQSVHADLVNERALRHAAEDRLAEALKDRLAILEKLRRATAAPADHGIPRPAEAGRPGRKARVPVIKAEPPAADHAAPIVVRRGRKPKTAAAPNGEALAKPARGPGRPRKPALVEWWKPGWNSRP